MNIIGNEGHGIVIDDVDVEGRLLSAYPKANSVEQVWNKVSNTWNTIAVVPQGIGRQFKAMRAELKRKKKEQLAERSQRQEMIHRGAAKILGLAASHIYANKPV